MMQKSKSLEHRFFPDSSIVWPVQCEEAEKVYVHTYRTVGKVLFIEGTGVANGNSCDFDTQVFQFHSSGSRRTSPSTYLKTCVYIHTGPTKAIPNQGEMEGGYTY